MHTKVVCCWTYSCCYSCRRCSTLISCCIYCILLLHTTVRWLFSLLCCVKVVLCFIVTAAMGEDQIFVGKNWENLYLKIFEFFSVLMLFIIFFNITTCLWLPFKHISWHFQPKPSRPRGPPCPYQFDKHPIKCRKWILRIQSKRRSESLFLIHTYTTHRLTRASHHIFTWTPFNQWSILIPGRHHSKGSIQIFLEPIEFFF